MSGPTWWDRHRLAVLLSIALWIILGAVLGPGLILGRSTIPATMAGGDGWIALLVPWGVFVVVPGWAVLFTVMLLRYGTPAAQRSDVEVDR